MFNPDYKDLLKLFNEGNVEYMVVGAYAMAAHGIVRATGDMDLFVRPEPANAERVHGALMRFGAPLTKITPSDFSTPGTVYQIGVIPCRIDILNQIDGVPYESAHTITKNIEGIPVPFIDLASLRRNKRSTGRPKDQSDLELLRTLGDDPEPIPHSPS